MNILCVDDEVLALNELSYLILQAEPTALIEQVTTIQEAQQKLLTKPYDLLFLDIHLTNESGLDLAQVVRLMPKAPLIVFATAYHEYALKAFELEAMDYVLKPFEQEKIMSVLLKAKQYLNKNQPTVKEVAQMESKRIPIKTQESIQLVNPEAICFVEAVDGGIKVYTNKQVYFVNETLKHFEQRLPEEIFMRIHRSYVVQVAQIQTIEPWFNQTYQLTLTNGEKVQVSRSYLPTFRKRLRLD
ncbi:LytR/AlgR family response regulator transcription factor [Atopobacter phocae]|uniref:LytR/AlgR family response regulator transcription factor n=1 Tax=Atopobacter phocae TaxID=136492 RepID=UPI000470BC38|nr:LytTR family transcriptional regulator DNA-binding domain-containing protein [Atopobacter phocae]